MLSPYLMATFFALPVLALTAPPVREVDRACRGGSCVLLGVEGGNVVYSSPLFGADVVLGSYVPAAQSSVPKEEAPIRDLSAPGGWRVVISAILDHDELGSYLTVRFFGPGGRPRGFGGGEALLVDASAGELFGPGENFLAVVTQGQHTYVTRTEIWLLPKRGSAVSVLGLWGWIVGIEKAGRGRGGGVWVDRETYDGDDASTKGTVREYYEWHAETRSFTVASKPSG